MNFFNIRKYAGMTSLVTSGVLVLSGCGYSIVGQNLDTGNNNNGYSEMNEYYIEPSFDMFTSTEEVSSEFNFNNTGCGEYIYDSKKQSIIENTECDITAENVNVDSITTESCITSNESITTEYSDCNIDEIIYDASEGELSSDDEPFAYAGQHEYMNNIHLNDDVNSIRGKIIYASGFSGASNNFIVLDDSCCNPGFNVVTYYINDGNGNYTSQILCVCAKRIDLVNGIPVIYFRNDNDVANVVRSKALSTDKVRFSDLYSKNLCNYPVNVDADGNEFITYNGMELDKGYMKIK